MPEWIEAAAFAEMIGKTRRTVNRLCRDGMLKCKKIGRTWYVSKSELY